MVEFMTVEEIATKYGCDQKDVEQMIKGLVAVEHPTLGLLIRHEDFLFFLGLFRHILLNTKEDRNLLTQGQKNTNHSEPSKNENEPDQHSSGGKVYKKHPGEITGKEAADIIGCRVSDIKSIIERYGLKARSTRGNGHYINLEEFETFVANHQDLIDSLKVQASVEVQTKPEGFITGAEAGAILGISPGEIKRLVIEKKLRGYTHGRGAYLDPAEVQKYKKLRDNHGGQPDSNSDVGASSNQGEVKKSGDGVVIPEPGSSSGAGLNLDQSINGENKYLGGKSDKAIQELQQSCDQGPPNNGASNSGLGDVEKFVTVKVKNGTHPGQKVCSIEDIANQIGVARTSVQKWIEAKKVEPVQMRRDPTNPNDERTEIYIEVESLKKFLREDRKTSLTTQEVRGTPKAYS